MNMNRRHRREAGLTMIEVVIASVILTALVAMTSWLVWSASNTVATTEVTVQMEMTAREVLSQMAKELHQSNFSMVEKVNTGVLIPTDATSIATAYPTPPVGGTMAYPVWDPTNPTANVFDGIRYRIPGAMMDLTTVDSASQVNYYDPVTKTMSKKKTNFPMSVSANADLNGKTDPLTNKKYDNFDLAAFKKAAGASKSVDWVYEVQYWWEIDTTALEPVRVQEGKAGAGPNGFVRDFADHNKNGVMDEGVIKKMETFYRTDLTVERRTVSTILRDVTQFEMYVPSYPSWVVAEPGKDPTKTTSYKYPPVPSGSKAPPPNQFSSGGEQNVVITITVQKPDPRYPRMSGKILTKTVSTTIDLRN
jgi:type II secretory pathway pseudopilin PulG